MFNIEKIGVRLTEDHLMIPAKSISGVIGGLAVPEGLSPPPAR